MLDLGKFVGVTSFTLGKSFEGRLKAVSWSVDELTINGLRDVGVPG